MRSLLRGMIAVCGNRQSERVAEEGGDREPVGEPADHRRLGEGFDVAERGMKRLECASDGEDHGHDHEQARSR